MKYVGVAVLVLWSVVNGFAQMQQGERQQQGPQQGLPTDEQPQFFFFETINLIAADETKSRIDVPYRIDEHFLVPVKNSDTSLPFPFRRRGEVLIELLDEKGVSKARTIQLVELGATSAELQPETKSWYEGIASFTVAPGEYTVVFELDDMESERHFLDRNRKITAKKFDGFTMETSTPLFVAAGTSGAIVPMNFGGNIAFGKDASLFLQLYSQQRTLESVRVEYSIETQNFMLQDPKVLFADTIQELALLPKANLELKKDREGQRYDWAAINTNHVAAILIPLHAEKLPLRPMKISLKIKQGNSEATIEQPFRMIWPEMPLSMRDVDFALEVLRHIVHEDELDSLRSGGRDMRLKHLEEFWKMKDRTPETEYNEMMVEYYRRVDYTMRTFNSMRALDGYKSDRGRIYILHGPPTRTERILDPAAGYQEVWVYEGKNKKFVFADQSKSGNYTLVSTQNL